MSPHPAAAVVPAWLTKLVIGALLTALIGGWVAWEGSMRTNDAKQTERIGVIEEHNRGIDKDIADIKHSQERIEDKLDRALRRSPHGE